MKQAMITGSLFRNMVESGAALLEKNRTAIDALNVFPVPDGDTGTNMSMTMQGAVREIRKLPEAATLSQTADAVSMGALRGARGNSGVILSQIFRGFSKACRGKEEMDAGLLTVALRSGTDSAYRAVMKPKEGTILTVIRRMTEAAETSCSEGMTVLELLRLAVQEGEKALRETPDMLPVLKEAGVVDSGGKGLLTVFEGFLATLAGEPAVENVEIIREMETGSTGEAALLKEEEIAFGYCTEFFIVHLQKDFSEQKLEDFRRYLMKAGDSVVAVHDGDIVKVHVHSNCPGEIIQKALRLGEIDRFKLENMRQQNRELLEERKRNRKPNALIAVCTGEGIEKVFREIGADRCVTGGQTMNPSIETIATAVKQANADTVFILPNNSNIIMAAQQAARLADCRVIVLPTKNIPQGIAAAMALERAASDEQNEADMQKAISSVISGSVTYAVRDTSFHGEEIAIGDILGMINGELTSVGKDVDTVAETVAADMMEKAGDEEATVTLIYGADVSEEEAERLGEKLEERWPDADIILQSGGQPLYYYYISVE